MMTPKKERKLLDSTATAIQKQAQAALDQVMALIAKKIPPRDALQQVTKTFKGSYAKELSAAFSEILQASVGEKSVLGMYVGGVSLSQRFYRETQAINATVLGLINSHAKGFDQARDLTLKIFEGYGFKGQEVLKLRPGHKALPKYLRDELLIDPGIQGELARHFARAQALRLKTPGLKAAYLEYLDAIETGAGMDFLEKKLQGAYYEKMRYFANRIAQTELHRAYALTNARELLKDTDVEWVQYRMSRTHPQMDICDLYAKRDLYGMGPGIYPVGKCPLAPIHPHCRCVVAPRLDIHETAKGARRKPNADRDFLAGLSDRHAAMVMGSRAKADLVLGGLDATDVFNAGTDPLYQVRPLEEAIKKHGMVVPKPTRAKAVQKPKAAPAAPQVQPKLKTPEDFIALGRERLKTLPAPTMTPDLFTKELLAALDKEVGISKPCQVAGLPKISTAIKNVSKRFPNSWTEASDNFYLPLSGQISYDRACYQPSRGSILSDPNRVNTLTHEFAHRLQQVMPGLDDIFQALHKKRTAGDPLEDLATIFGGAMPGEFTRKDNYVDAYQGKEYAWNKGREALEVMSVAFEAVLGYHKNNLSRADLIKSMYYGDREMFELTVGLLFGWKP